MKKALILEFVSCFIISIAATIVFAPFDWYFGLINGLIISVLIVLPFAISDAIWSCEKVSLKLFFVKFGHKTVAISLAFMLAATLNNLFIPMVLR